jgi:hypothetical protein
MRVLLSSCGACSAAAGHRAYPARPDPIAYNVCIGGQFSSDGSLRIGDFGAAFRIDLEAIIAKRLDAAHLSGWRVPSNQAQERRHN